MPPNGLYQVPRHHLHGNSTLMTRPVYNSVDFQEGSPEPAAREKKEKKEKKRETKEKKEKVKQEKKEKKSKRRPFDTQDKSDADKSHESSVTPNAPATLVHSDSKGKESRENRKRSKKTDEAGTSTKKRKKESLLQSAVPGHHKDLTVEANGAAIKTPVPLPPNVASKQTPVSLPSKTSVPFLQYPPSKYAVMALKDEHTPTKVSRGKSQVLVAETPLSQMSRTTSGFTNTPIPFNLSSAAAKTTPVRRGRPKKDPIVDITPQPKTHNTLTQAATLSAILNSAEGVSEFQKLLKGMNSSQTSLTSTNLEQFKQFTQPLSAKVKPRPHARSASVGSSTGSSKSSMSIVEAFARVGKPYSRSGAEFDPFISPEATKKKKKPPPRETHPEADVTAFTTAFRAAQRAVNFTDEQEYVAAHLSRRAAATTAGPLPCLHKMTGCDPQSEQMLHLSKQRPANLTVHITNSTDASALPSAAARCATAETLLLHALAARLPVPLGRVEGAWKLFCPTYSAIHVDKYGFGQRVLTIASIAGFKGSAYTAKLSLPPRAMVVNVLAFTAPPHASFRATVVKATGWGGRMELVFLGNGYLLLRLDLHLMLMGKQMLGKGGKAVVMEFVGVHEQAVEWVEGKDELEEVGKRLFAKYDGEGERE